MINLGNNFPAIDDRSSGYIYFDKLLDALLTINSFFTELFSKLLVMILASEFLALALNLFENIFKSIKIVLMNEINCHFLNPPAIAYLMLDLFYMYII